MHSTINSIAFVSDTKKYTPKLPNIHVSGALSIHVSGKIRIYVVGIVGFHLPGIINTQVAGKLILPKKFKRNIWTLSSTFAKCYALFELHKSYDFHHLNKKQLKAIKYSK